MNDLSIWVIMMKIGYLYLLGLKLFSGKSLNQYNKAKENDEHGQKNHP